MKEYSQIWPIIEAHFSKLSTLSSEDQKNYLSYLHDTNPELHQILNELLLEEENLHPLFSQSAVNILETWQDHELIGTHIGIYQLIKLLGQGAMASVFQAKRDDGEFDQSVALKLIKPGIYDDQTLKLFKKERQTLATLQHPHIARLYDGGVNQDGRPFFTMEYIDGPPITNYCEENRLDLIQRLQLFKQISNALGYAHSRLVAHLDLKPGNILVDQSGQVKVLDFGIARMIPAVEIKNGLSSVDELIEYPKRFTLAYASPELIKNEEVDSSSDIYSLGIILFELVVGQHPYYHHFNNPSALKKAITKGRYPKIADFKSSLPSGIKITRTLLELEKIWQCAHSRNREDRYGTVESIIRDIDAFINKEPLSVIEPSSSYHAKKFIQRNSRIVSALTLALITLFGTITFYTKQVKQERDLARIEAVKSVRVTDLLSGIFKMADPNLANGDTITAIQLLVKGLKDMDASLNDQPQVKASLLHEITSIFTGLGQYQLADSLAWVALRLTDSLYENPHPERARSLLELGRVESIYKNLDTAFIHLNASYQIFRNIKPTDPVSIADVLLELSNLSYEKGEYNVSDSIIRQVYKIHRKIYNAPHEELANDLQMIGSSQRKLGNFEDAATYYEQSLSMKRKLFKPPHNEIAYTLNHLASLKQDLGLYQEAIPYARESYDQRLQIYGPLHLETIASQSNLARIFKSLGEYDKSISIYEEVLGKLKKIFPDGHPYISAILQSLADLYSNNGRIDLAEQFYREAIRLDKKFLDKDDIHWSNSLIGLGKLLTRMNQLDEAKSLLESAYHLRKKNLPEGHALIGISQQALGECLLAMKDYQTTIYFLNEAFGTLSTSPDLYRDNLKSILQGLIIATDQIGTTSDQNKYQKLLANLSS